MKYYENYLADVTLTLAVDGKETDHCRWETCTLFDSHVAQQSSMSRSEDVDHNHNCNQSIGNGKLLSVSLEVGAQWNDFVFRDQVAGHSMIPL